MKPEILHCRSEREISQKAAELICDLVQTGLQNQGVFSIALAGGQTPRPLYEYLATPPFVTKMPWQDIHLFWGDERWVAPDHRHSNFAMANQALISRLSLPSSQIHQIPTGLKSPVECAEEYETHLKDFFGHIEKTDKASQHESKPLPSFDLILLGMGQDGHTASLFPGSSALTITDRWVVAVDEPASSPSVARITLTLPVINAARNVLFLVSGEKKRKIVQTILDDPGIAAGLYPAALVQPQERLIWCIAE